MSSSHSEVFSRLADKIAKLLALARDSAAAPNEAATALRQARALMTKHQIDESAVLSARLDSDLIEEEWIDLESVKEVSQFLVSLIITVAKYNHCEVRNFDSTLHIYGHAQNVLMAKWMYEWLLDIIKRKRADIRTAAQLSLVGKIPLTARGDVKKALYAERMRRAMQECDDYTSGFCVGICEQLRTEPPAAESQALVVDMKSALERKFGTFTYQTTRIRVGQGFDHGVSDGKSQTISRPLGRQLLGSH